jgi:hypothetical protein
VAPYCNYFVIPRVPIAPQLIRRSNCENARNRNQRQPDPIWCCLRERGEILLAVDEAREFFSVNF